DRTVRRGYIHATADAELVDPTRQRHRALPRTAPATRRAGADPPSDRIRRPGRGAVPAPGGRRERRVGGALAPLGREPRRRADRGARGCRAPPTRRPAAFPPSALGRAGAAGQPDAGADARSRRPAPRRAARRPRSDDAVRSAAGPARRLRAAGKDSGDGDARSRRSGLPRRQRGPAPGRAHRAAGPCGGARAGARRRVRRTIRPGAQAVAVIALALAAALQIGSKQFTESVILAEIAVQTLRAAGVEAEHRREVGGTRVLWEALRARQIDLYPEYTGTIVEELLGGERDLGGALPRLGLRAGGSLGFEDTYAIGMRRAESERQGIRSLSDLARHRELEIGLTNEFLRRRDGW